MQASVEQVRRILYKWGHAKEIVRNLNEMKMQMRELLESLIEDVSFGATQLTGMPGAHAQTDSVSRDIIRRENITKKLGEYDKLMDDTTRLKMRVDQLISTFQPITITILKMRFEDDLPWELIAGNVNMSVTAVRDRERVVCEQLRTVMLYETLSKANDCKVHIGKCGNLFAVSASK